MPKKAQRSEVRPTRSYISIIVSGVLVGVLFVVPIMVLLAPSLLLADVSIVAVEHRAGVFVTDLLSSLTSIWPTLSGLLFLALICALTGLHLQRQQTQQIRHRLGVIAERKLPIAGQIMPEGRTRNDELNRIVESFEKLLRQLQHKETALDHLQGQLSDRSSQLDTLIELVPSGVLIADERLNIVLVNGAIEDIFGYSASELQGRDVNNLLPPDFRDTHRQLIDDFAHGDTSVIHTKGRGHLKTETRSGDELYLDIAVATMAVNEGRIFLAVIEDATHQKVQNDIILRQAHYDILTGLPNRFLAMDRMTQLMAKAKRGRDLVAVLVLDLDDFKKVNDSLGHEVGDRILIEAARRIKATIREEDTAGRLGGDEFILLLGGLRSQMDVQLAIEGLLFQFRKPFVVNDHELLLTSSIGVAFFPSDGLTESDLLRNADSAMYHSKRLGRNTFSFYAEEMNDGITRRLALEAQLSGALARKEFSVVFQPKFGLGSNRVIGAEALLRWHNPSLGRIAPDEFIPILEQTGMIVEVGQFVLEQSLQKTRLWQQWYDHDFSIAVNLSPRQFRDPHLVESIKDIAVQAGVAFSSLELEITEGVLMSGCGNTEAALKSLSAAGIKFSLDDFGTGYSSISYLRMYPFDVLKIDQSFVRDIMDDEQDRALVGATVAMAHRLGLKVVAEGVETPEQVSILQGLECDLGQGYLLGRPFSSLEMDNFLKQQVAV